MCGLDEEDLSPEAAPLMKESSGTVLREAFPMILRAVMAADPITGSVDEEQAETARREAVDALIAAFSTAAAEAETASSSGWYSLDRPGCVGCSGKGPAARAWAAAHPGASSTSAAPPPSRDAQAQANFDAALAGQPLPFPERQAASAAAERQAESAAEKEAEKEAEKVEPRPRALTAQAFASRTLTWNDMEPIGVFAGRMPASVSGGPVGQTGDTRRFQYDFPGGGAIILLARPCERGRGLCVWAVDIE